MWLLILFTIYAMLTFKSIQSVFKGRFTHDVEKLRQSLASSSTAVGLSIFIIFLMSLLVFSFYVEAGATVQNNTFYYMSILQCIFCIMIFFSTVGKINKLYAEKTYKFPSPLWQVSMALYDTVYGVMFVYLGGLDNLF